jgi:hypothetical protein
MASFKVQGSFPKSPPNPPNPGNHGLCTAIALSIACRSAAFISSIDPSPGIDLNFLPFL